MSDELLINVTPQETRIATIENGLLQEVLIERECKRGLVGNIYKAKVSRVLPGMQAAFLDIGLARTAFLHLSDIVLPKKLQESIHDSGKLESDISITQVLREGQEILVQVIKDPISTKGARLTTHITIPARYLVYMPNNSHIGISQRLTDENERTRLKNSVQQYQNEFGGGGYIIRTVAECKTDQAIYSDMAFLKKLWDSVIEKNKIQKAATLIHEDLRLVMKTMRDISEDNISSIRIDSKETYNNVQTFAEKFIPELVSKIKYYPGEGPIFDLFGVESEIHKALQPKILLKSGGYLIIDQTEAMTTVDVNTGSYVGNKNLEETIFKTNLEATQAIARQLRLRNLGGIIIIDFIDMQSAEHRRQVLRSFEKSLARDTIKSAITEVSNLGLVEMTRKRTRENLEQILCEPCPICNARGTIKTVETLAFEIFREIMRVSRQYDTDKILVLTSKNVADFLLEEQSSAIAELEEFIALSICFQINDDYNQEQFDVVPM
ncbi:MAG: ribonuclease G [Pseudomonadota bacterium]